MDTANPQPTVPEQASGAAASQAYANPVEPVEPVIERDEIAQLVLCCIVCFVARFELTTEAG